MKMAPRILTVDEDPAIAELILPNLRHNGSSTFWAEDGQSALQKLDNELPDVLHAGINCPDSRRHAA